jgi:hypothetical protein
MLVRGGSTPNDNTPHALAHTLTHAQHNRIRALTQVLIHALARVHTCNTIGTHASRKRDCKEATGGGKKERAAEPAFSSNAACVQVEGESADESAVAAALRRAEWKALVRIRGEARPGANTVQASP